MEEATVLDNFIRIIVVPCLLLSLVAYIAYHESNTSASWLKVFRSLFLFWMIVAIATVFVSFAVMLIL